MTDSYRLTVELPNGAKFRAQGHDPSEVRTDLERFYSLLIAVPAPPTATNATNTSTITAAVAPESTPSNGNGATDLLGTLNLAPTDGIDQTMLSRLFAKDSHGTVSLRALPHGDSADTDALVALIYGAGRLANEQQVTGSRLMKAATQSGLHQVERIDRALNPAIGQYVTTAGFKKGRRYGLTNPGIRRAEEILIGILG